MVRVHAKAGPWGRPNAAYPMRSFERTFLRWNKNHFWAKVHWRSVHARVRKPFRKKCQQTRSGVPPEQRTPRQDQKMKKCVTYKNKNPGGSTHRKWQQERDPERPAPTRQPKQCFVKKTRFFEKKRAFFTYAWFLYAGCQLRSVPEEAELAGPRVPFAFLQNFFKKTPDSGRDAISA